MEELCLKVVAMHSYWRQKKCIEMLFRLVGSEVSYDQITREVLLINVMSLEIKYELN